MIGIRWLLLATFAIAACDSGPGGDESPHVGADVGPPSGDAGNGPDAGSEDDDSGSGEAVDLPARPIPVAGVVASSLWASEWQAENAIDASDTSAWCAAAVPPDGAKLHGATTWQTFDDWLELRFDSPVTIGAIHMKSGWFGAEGEGTGARADSSSNKIRRFVWATRTEGSDAWVPIPETDLYANRYQLILRFPERARIAAVRLQIRSRSFDREELQVASNNTPCLRDVAFYERSDARIYTAPWFLHVATWDDAGSRYDTHRTYSLRGTLRRLFHDLTGDAPTDVEDNLWIGELHRKRVVRQFGAGSGEGSCGRAGSRMLLVEDAQGEITRVEDCNLGDSEGFADWVLHEPAPAGVLLSGNFRDYHDRSPELASGLFHFLRSSKDQLAILGACGGHQLLGMSMVHATYDGFAGEFAPDTEDSVYRICSHMLNLGDTEMCSERGDTFQMQQVGARRDVLFSYLDDASFPVYLSHYGLVQPSKLAEGGLELIASYPGLDPQDLPAPTPSRATQVQGMKLTGRPVYGTQFHWDVVPGSCSPGLRNMATVLKNFTLLAMNRIGRPGGPDIVDSSSAARVPALSDLDRTTAWCPGGRRGLTIALHEATPLRYLLLWTGRSMASQEPLDIAISISMDGRQYVPVAFDSESANGRLRGIEGCADEESVDDDDAPELITLREEERARYVKLEVIGEDPCVRELNVLSVTNRR